MISLRSLLLTALLATVPLLAADDLAEPIMLAADETEIPKYRELTLPVDLKGKPEEADVVLEFSAWYRTDKPKGYFSTLRLYWDNKEITEALDRPPSFTMPNISREEPTRRDSGFMVAAIPRPETMEDSSERYYVPKEHVDMLFFRFRIHDSPGGEHKLRIRNRLTGPLEIPLVVKDVKIRFVKEAN